MNDFASGVRHFTEDEVNHAISPAMALVAVRESFLRLGRGESSHVPRSRAKSPHAVLHTMSAIDPALGLAGFKSYLTSPRGARFVVGVFDLATGNFVATIEANRLGQLRTAAATACAVDRFSAANASTLGIVGSGYQAAGQFEALATIRPWKKVVIVARERDKGESFAAEWNSRTGLKIGFDSNAEALRDADVIVTATNAARPVLQGNEWRPGALVCAIGSNWPHKAEIASGAFKDFRRVVCDDIAACQWEAGDLIQAAASGDFAWAQAEPLGLALAQTETPRSGGTILFKSVGIALEDLALAKLLL